jgi:hypothetical protein
MAEVTRYARRIDQVVSSEGTRVRWLPREDARRRHLSTALRSLRSAVSEQPRPGVFVFVVADPFGHVGRLWLAADETARSGVVGRHDFVDLLVGFDDELSLRHAMFVVRRLEGRVRYTVLDLDTPNGLVSAENTPVHCLESERLLSFRTGPFSFFCVPTGAGCDVPDDLERAWLRFDAPPLRREATWRHRLMRRWERGAGGVLTLEPARAAGAWPVSAEDLARGVLVGRSERCGVHLASDDRVSRVHAVLVSIDDVPHIIEAGSTNGIWSGETKVRCQPLQDGDLFEFGRTRLRWRSAH